MINEYNLKINKAIDYIEKSDDLSELNLEILSREANLSKFHFHRVFQSVMNETLNNYINRIKLEKAIFMILYNKDLSITEIVHKIGFSSSSNFNKLFKRTYNFKPSDLRKNEFDKALLKGKQIKKTTIIPDNIDYNDVRIIKLPRIRVAYYRTHSGYNSDNIASNFNKIITWAGSNNLINQQTLFLGIPYDDNEISPVIKCRYDSAVSIPDKIKCPPDINEMIIEEGWYAARDTSCLQEEIEASWDRYYKNYLLKNNVAADDRPYIDIFNFDDHNSGSDNTGKLKLIHCIPIIKK